MNTNPLQLLPASIRAGIYIIAIIVGVSAPILIPELSGVARLAVTVVAAVAALFASGQGLSNLTPDSENAAIQGRNVPNENTGGTDE